mmetsp:Transcript_48574/g.113740  ORF Transcript_48574/g.113740 Transcript_48574/m.113740 type:complete len:393 (-) Transcript_48574:56-1234(-)
MLGLVAYDSDDEQAEQQDSGAKGQGTPALVPAAALVTDSPAPLQHVPKATSEAVEKLPDPTGAAIRPVAKAAAAVVSAKKLQEVKKEVSVAKSATAVVQVIRKSIETAWDIRWGAEALLQIAKRSTARTRKEWVQDNTVKKLVALIEREISNNCDVGDAGGRVTDVDSLLLALEGMRRLGFQIASEQSHAAELALKACVDDAWRQPAHSLARLYWLGQPLHLPGGEDALAALERASTDLQGPELSLIVAALKGAGAGKHQSMLQKVISRLKVEGVHKGLSATDLVEMAEGLRSLNAHEEAALRPLGQEILRRRVELTPDETNRVQRAYEAMKLPLHDVWTRVGAAAKRDASQITTTQAFLPQDGHEKKRRGNNDIERTSPPRVVRDMKMCSY